MNTNKTKSAVLTAFALGAMLTVAGIASSGPAHAQDNARLAVNIFRGDTGTVNLGAWGSGNAEITREAVYAGDTSLRITTHGLYQGGRIDLKQPVDLSAALGNPNAYMRFQVRFTGSQKSGSQGGFGGDFSQGGPPSGGGLRTGGRAPGGFGGPPTGFGGPPAGFGGFGDTQAPSEAPFQHMRFLMVMEDGSQYELLREVTLPLSDNQDGYVPVAFPMAVLAKKMGDKTQGAVLKSIAVFGDKFEQFYIGEISILTDETEISVAPLDDQILFALQPAVFAASAEGGTSSLKYSWDFDASDGLQTDAEGRVVTHTFPRVGGERGEKTYIITLTVTDRDGIKKPARVTLETTVGD